MARKKLIRFEENNNLPNLFQPDFKELEKGIFLKGKWRELYFKNNNPIVLELGCGKGEYSVGMAERFSNKNFIGIDLKGSRMWVGCKLAIEKKLNNVAFIRRHISNIEMLFEKDEVDEIWITFPDPHLRESDAKKRLTSPEYIARYSKLLKNNALIHLKTDCPDLYEYTQKVVKENGFKLISQSDDIYSDRKSSLLTEIQTYYEKIWLNDGLKIKYISFIPFAESTKEELNKSFFEKVWEVTRKIPKGRVTTYGAIARYLGTTSSARMVGWALNSTRGLNNPVPAHRVVNRNGMLTGKFYFGGINEMQKLLEMEGIKIENDIIVNFEKLYWEPK